ncbi:MAG: hypothetical protein ACREBC_26115, partial [Pyrinomonadaceae bacterium]
MSDEASLEQWQDAESGSVWERNPTTKVFSLISHHEQQVDGRWEALDIAKALCCGLSSAPDDGALDSRWVTFPPGFKLSPNTGKPLVKKAPRTGTWLPFSGAEGLKSGLLRGGCLTAHPLKLKGDASPTRDPERQLPLPGRGNYRFCVGAFGLSSSFLLAFEARQGAIYCWLPSRCEWVEMAAPSGAPYLGAEDFPLSAWSIEARDLANDTVVFWPADCGLVAIKVNILSLAYEARLLAEGRCVSVPRVLGNRVYILVEKPDGAVGVVSVDAAWQSAEQPLELAVNGMPAAKWVVATATPREVIWLSEKGQVVLRPTAQQCFFIPWEPGVEPQFRLGGPHCSADGRLWMQVLHPTLHEGEKGFGYIQLGRPNPEQRPSSGARTLTGHSSIKVEQQLKEDPWVEPAVAATAGHENNEAVVPILESMSDGTL